MLFGEAVSMATPIPPTERAQVTCFHESFPPSLHIPQPQEEPAQPQGCRWTSPQEKLQGCCWHGCKVPHATLEEARESPEHSMQGPAAPTPLCPMPARQPHRLPACIPMVRRMWAGGCTLLQDTGIDTGMDLTHMLLGHSRDQNVSPPSTHGPACCFSV